jgi:hypothetical protein
MAYRNPRWGLLHAAREAGAAAITSTTEDASFPHENLIDDRAGTLFKFTASAANLQIDLDRGAGFAALTGIDRLYIPDGHNLSSTIDVFEDDNSGFSSATTLLSAGAVPASGAVDLDITESSERYIRVEFNGTGQWELPQLILTKTLTTTRGPDPDWRGPVPEENALHARKASGATAHLQLGADQDSWRFVYNRVLEATDLTNLDSLLDLGSTPVFLFDPPDDSAYPAILATLTLRDRRNDHPNPAGVSGRRMRYEFSLLEHIG